MAMPINPDIAVIAAEKNKIEQQMCLKDIKTAISRIDDRISNGNKNQCNIPNVIQKIRNKYDVIERRLEQLNKQRIRPLLAFSTFCGVRIDKLLEELRKITRDSSNDDRYSHSIWQIISTVKQIVVKYHYLVQHTKQLSVKSVDTNHSKKRRKKNSEKPETNTNYLKKCNYNRNRIQQEKSRNSQSRNSQSANIKKQNQIIQHEKVNNNVPEEVGLSAREQRLILEAVNGMIRKLNIGDNKSCNDSNINQEDFNSSHNINRVNDNTQRIRYGSEYYEASEFVRTNQRAHSNDNYYRFNGNHHNISSGHKLRNNKNFQGNAVTKTIYDAEYPSDVQLFHAPKWWDDSHPPFTIWDNFSYLTTIVTWNGTVIGREDEVAFTWEGRRAFQVRADDNKSVIGIDWEWFPDQWHKVDERWESRGKWLLLEGKGGIRSDKVIHYGGELVQSVWKEMQLKANELKNKRSKARSKRVRKD